jgi:hydrogenase maturation factor
MTLRAGKLPQEQLARLLASLPRRDPRVLLGPGIGRDAAVIDIGGGRVLVAKMDPVTFATEHIGWYAVNVNANDIACMGARPAWFMATALLPPGAPDGMPRRIFDELTAACDALGIELVGGHTEVTVGLDRPIIAGAMLGEAGREEIVTGVGAVPGDVVLLAGGIAIEGTAILAQEAAPALTHAGVPAAVIERASALMFDPGISVVPAAQAVCDVSGPRILHDPTEGGIATALQELAHAAGLTLRIDVEAIDILPETRAVCDALSLNPLGLIASGSLLAIVPAGEAPAVKEALADLKIACQTVGSAEYGAPKVIMASEESTPLPLFERDELARYFDGMARG